MYLYFTFALFQHFANYVSMKQIVISLKAIRITIPQLEQFSSQKDSS